MDEYSSRKTSGGGVVVSKKAPGLALKENKRERNAQVCSRVGCSSNLNSLKTPQIGIGSPSKVKPLRASPHSSALGKEICGSSSRTAVGVNSSRKSFSNPKKKSPSRAETDSETSSLQEEGEVVSESITTSRKTKIMVHPKPKSYEHDARSTTLAEIVSSSSGPPKRFVKRNSQKFGSGLHQDSHPVGSSSFKQRDRGSKSGPSTTTKYNLKNLRCNSLSDVVPTGSSSTSMTESSVGRKRDTGRKRIGDPETSVSARGNKTNGRNNEGSNCGISICDSRTSRNPGDNETPSMRTRRPTPRTRFPIQERLLTSSSPLSNIARDAQNHPSNHSVRSRPNNRSIDPCEVGIARPFMNRDALRQYNLDGIAEMLLALERIEQEDESTYEQLLVMESNVLLGGFAFHDQHREMRLDIDNMSYEELLALEERMGTVSTALSEEDLTKCLTRSKYQGTIECREDDVKCSICQEDYASGDEVGRLGCDHKYHVDCIQQWLSMKNWCPICKASAAPSPSPSPSPSGP